MAPNPTVATSAGEPFGANQSVQNALPAAKDRANRTLDLERENSSDQHASPATLSVASEPILEDEISQGPVHLNTILEELSTSPPKSTPLQDANSPRTLDKWILACFRSYIAHFHHRWHIITASTYEFTEKPPDNAASVVMVGSYFLHRKDLTGTIVNIHDRLVDRYLHLLTSALEEGKLSNTVRRLETYQAILLNIIFGLYLGSYAQHIQQSEFPGHYVPWIDMVLDEWKRFVTIPFASSLRALINSTEAGTIRIICALFKVETQIALIYHQRPRLLDDELDAFLPSSFALRNCFRMDVFLHRRKIEDPSRSQVKMLRMIRHPEKFLPNAVLVEDIHLGLCGLLFDTLRQAQLRAVIGTWDDPSAIAMRDGVVQRLAVWAKHLKALAEKSRSDGSSLADMQFISTYLDREDEIRSRPLDMRLVKARVKSMINEVTMLYHLLQLLLSVGRRIIEHLKFMAAINLDSIKEDERVRYDEAKSVLESWAGSTEGRTALLHALAMLSIAQVYLKEHSAVLEYPFPGSISHITIALSALVLDGWLAHKYSTCCCGTTAAHLDLPIKSWGLDDAVLEAWIQYDGPALFQGKTLCTCSSDVWIERFANCLPEEETWELAGLIAPPLRSFMRRM
ncbi:hypothetical protein TruAng_006851 [Truncatella angustata]|nr:hypothetical protein TruAng_006851 [Truncatella angustata]